jgi:hypothetical protein
MFAMYPTPLGPALVWATIALGGTWAVWRTIRVWEKSRGRSTGKLSWFGVSLVIVGGLGCWVLAGWVYWTLSRAGWLSLSG